MVKINENDVLISRHELFVLIGAACSHEIRESKLDAFGLTFTQFAAAIYCRTAQHIWEEKKLPEKSIDCLLNAITPEGTEKKGKRLESYEGMHSICKLLLAALQKTRAFYDLTDLKYDPYSGVIAEFSGGGYRMINVECDSGIAMIKDILAHL